MTWPFKKKRWVILITAIGGDGYYGKVPGTRVPDIEEAMVFIDKHEAKDVQTSLLAQNIINDVIRYE